MASDGVPRGGDAGVVVSVNVSAGGVPKHPVAGAAVSPDGVEGDRQRNLRYHGGPDRAVCLFAAEVIERLRAEGHPIGPGATGENVTIRGLQWSRVVPGTRLQAGSTWLEVTSYVVPCRTIAGSFLRRRSGRISQRTHPGESRVYARVLVAGRITAGDAVVLFGAAGSPPAA